LKRYLGHSGKKIEDKDGK